MDFCATQSNLLATIGALLNQVVGFATPSMFHRHFHNMLFA